MYLSTRRRHLSLLASAPLTFLAACSGFGNSGASAKDDMKLKIVINVLSTGNLPIYIAIDKNYFKDQGVTVGPIPLAMLPAQAQMTAAIASGTYDLCAGGIVTDLLTLTRVSTSIKLVGALQNIYGCDLTISNNLASQTGLTQDSPLEDRAKSVIGKTVGVISTTGGTHAFMEYLFRTLNLGDVDKQVTFQSLGGSSAGAIAALKTGRVDALSFPPPSGELAETQGIGHILISPAKKDDIPGVTGQLGSVFYANQNIISSKPNTLKAFIRAVATAQAFIQQKPDDAATILKKYLKIDDTTNSMLRNLTFSTYAPTPKISEQAYNLAGAFHVKAGMITAVPQFGTLVDTQLVDDALNGFTPKI